MPSANNNAPYFFLICHPYLLTSFHKIAYIQLMQMLSKLEPKNRLVTVMKQPNSYMFMQTKSVTVIRCDCIGVPFFNSFNSRQILIPFYIIGNYTLIILYLVYLYKYILPFVIIFSIPNKIKLRDTLTLFISFYIKILPHKSTPHF